MNIWLINPYGPIPGEEWRDYRFTILGKTLAEAGHRVVWWTANFSHHFKRFRSDGWADFEINPNFQVRLVPTTSYTRNVSLRRVRFEFRYAQHLYQRALNETPPDCIIAIDPPQSVGYTATRLARQFSARLIIDVMDLWPELFLMAFPNWSRSLVAVAFLPLYWLRKRNLSRADAITALCNTYLSKALEQIQPPQSIPAEVIFNGIDVNRFRALMQSSDIEREQVNGLKKADWELWAIFAGTLGNNYDIETMLNAGLLLRQFHSQVKILIAGDGPLLQRVTSFIRAHPDAQISYLGKFKPEELISIYKYCDVGLAAYSRDSNVAMPDKTYDYLAAGLPIVSSLPGELAELLEENQIGINYSAGDVKSFINALEILGRDEMMRRRLSNNSFQIGMRFDREIQYRKFLDVLH